MNDKFFVLNLRSHPYDLKDKVHLFIVAKSIKSVWD